MINTVRNTVLSVLNKNNYGYLSPSDFNLFAKQAQLDIFENYFYDYNSQINKENKRLSGTGYADITKGIEEAIDIFSETKGLYTSFENIYSLPSPTTTGSDYYLLNKVLVRQVVTDEGTTTAFAGTFNEIIDSAADFILAGVSVGDLVAIESGGVQYLRVVSVNSLTSLTVTGVLLTAAGIDFAIYKKADKFEEAEKVSHGKITMLNNSLLTAPTVTYPSYTMESSDLTVYPEAIDSVGRVMVQYIRHPKAPNWTFLTLTNGEPVFSPAQPDYQDFEIPLDDEVNLILKILQYAGISIREGEVYNFAQTEELENNKEQL